MLDNMKRLICLPTKELLQQLAQYFLWRNTEISHQQLVLLLFLFHLEKIEIDKGMKEGENLENVGIVMIIGS
jgi:hypothetical protein